MSTIRETVFDLLFNALLQIGFFAVVTAILSRLVVRARARYQYFFYSVVLVLSLAAPAVNTVWQSHPVRIAERSLQQAIPRAEGANFHLWPWQGHSREHKPFTVKPEVQNCVVVLWGLFVLYPLARFSRGVHRVHRLYREAKALSPSIVGMASQIIDARHRITLLESTAIDDPVTVGIFHPAILLPSKVLPSLNEQDLLAILAHEYGHIRRRDFLANILLELLSLPVAWHPGIRYLMSKISQTRELACDDEAAARFGKRRLYARTLLRLASLCLHTPRASTVALGIFDGDNLEARIMMLTEKKPLLSRAGVVALTLALTIPFGAGAVLARAVTLQAGAISSNSTLPFAGTWHWMFDGRSFSTMVLVRSGSGYTGTVTPSRIALNDEGGLLKADPSEDSTPTTISRAELNGTALHITLGDVNQPFEFTVTLRDETHAEIHPAGAPPNMKPILAEKVR